MCYNVVHGSQALTTFFQETTSFSVFVPATSNSIINTLFRFGAAMTKRRSRLVKSNLANAGTMTTFSLFSTKVCIFLAFSL